MLFEPLICQSRKVTVLFYIKREIKERRGLGGNRFLVALSKLLKRIAGVFRNADIDSCFSGSHALKCIKSVSLVNRLPPLFVEGFARGGLLGLLF